MNMVFDPPTLEAPHSEPAPTHVEMPPPHAELPLDMPTATTPPPRKRSVLKIVCATALDDADALVQLWIDFFWVDEIGWLMSEPGSAEAADVDRHMVQQIEEMDAA